MPVKEYYPEDDILEAMSKEELKDVIRNVFTIEDYADAHGLYEYVRDEDYEYEKFRDEE